MLMKEFKKSKTAQIIKQELSRKAYRKYLKDAIAIGILRTTDRDHAERKERKKAWLKEIKRNRHYRLYCLFFAGEHECGFRYMDGKEVRKHAKKDFKTPYWEGVRVLDVEECREDDDMSI